MAIFLGGPAKIKLNEVQARLLQRERARRRNRQDAKSVVAENTANQVIAVRLRSRDSPSSAHEPSMTTASSAASLEEQLSDFGHERAQLLAKLEADPKQ